MSETRFEDWFIFIDGATALLGPSIESGGEYLIVSPIYRLEGAMNAVGNVERPGRVDVQRPVRVTPVLGLVSLREVQLPLTMPRVRIGSLSASDRRKVEKGVEICEDVVAKLRAEDAGITLARP